MARIARVVVPGFPHHITQRGSRRQRIFFSKHDFQYYLGLLRQAQDKIDVAVWAYCLMPNHVHLVVVPENENDLARFFGPAHRKYALSINHRMHWRGHLWQERFHSFVMDEPHLLAAIRYVELNPVRARLCASADEWKWSSARAHLQSRDDGLVQTKPMLERIGDWQAYLSNSDNMISDGTLRKHNQTGRPAGDDPFLTQLEALTKRNLKKLKPGPKAAR